MELIHVAGNDINRRIPVLPVKALYIAYEIIDIEQLCKLVSLCMTYQVTFF